MDLNYECEGQMSIFDLIRTQKDCVMNRPLRIIELFAGYGSQAMAFKRLGVPVEHHFVCEFDKYAIKSYNAIHGTNYEPTDIRDIHYKDLCITNTDRFTYLLTYSFPCTDLSVAGKGKGMSKEEWEQGNSTRSGLLWEVERLLKEIIANNGELPQILFMENVTQVHGKKNKADFDVWCQFLESLGYHNFWKDLNAKNYGVAQNRNRCYMFSFLDDVKYEFPKPIPLDKVMKDYLEEEVDEKYYITSEKAEKLIDKLLLEGKIAPTKKNSGILSNVEEKNKHQSGNVYGTDGMSPNIMAGTHGYGMGYILEKDMANVLIGGMQEHQSIKTDGVCTCLTSSMGTGGGYVPMVDEVSKLSKKSTETLGHIGVGGQKGFVYSVDSNSPCLPATQYKDPTKVIECKKVKIIGEMDNTIDHTFESANRVYDDNGLAPTINTCGGGGLQPKVVEVKEVNVETILFDRSGKAKEVDVCNTLTANDPNRTLGNHTPICGVCETKKVNSAAIRGRYNENGEIEQQLEVNDRDYTNTITSVQKDNVLVEQDRIVFESRCDEPFRTFNDNCCGTIRTIEAGGDKRVLEVDSIKVLGNYMPSEHNASRVVDSNGIAPTVKENHGTVTGVVEVINPAKGLSENGWHYEQNLYDTKGILRSLKAGGGSGNIPQIVESVVYDDYNSRIRADQTTVGTITTTFGNDAIRNGTKLIEINKTKGKQRFSNFLYEIDGEIYLIRIRKLTPRECGRLMSVSDADITKILEANSNTQAYKQFGNSIVVDVMCAMFSQLGFPGIKKWNEQLEEREVTQ